MKLNEAQIKALKHLSTHPATVMWETAGYSFKSINFWEELRPAKIQSFRSLVKRGLARIEGEVFYFITEEGKDFLSKL